MYNIFGYYIEKALFFWIIIFLIVSILLFIWVYRRKKARDTVYNNLELKTNSNSLNFELTRKDNINFMIYDFFHKPHLLVSILSIYGAFSLLAKWMPVKEALWIFFPIIYISLHLFEFILHFLAALLKRIEEYSLDITPKKMILRYKWGEESYSWEWKSFLKIKHNKNYFFLYTWFSKVIVLPKRIFKSEKKKEDFKKLLKNIKRGNTK